MRISRRILMTCSALALLAGLGTTMSCGKKKKSSSSSGGDDSITISGQLALTGESTSFRLDAPALTDLAVYCVTFTIPPEAGSGTVAEDGAFELTINTTDTSVGCFILQDTDILGTIVFQDPSTKGMDGEAQSKDRLAFSGGKSDFGAITLDLSTGKAIVDVSKIVTTSGGGLKDTSSIGDAADFTGAYTISSSGLTLPKGYVGTCANHDSDDCHGPMEGEKIWLKTIKGKDATSGAAKYAMMIWQSEELFKSCGEKLGVSYAAAKEHGIDLSESGVGEGDFTWDSSYIDGWKKADATARHSMMKMENVDDFKGYPGTKQYFKQYRTYNCTPNTPCDPSTSETIHTNSDGFQFNANTKESGCRDAAGKPYQMNDWSGMECTWEALSGASAGLSKNTCSKTVSGSKISCVNISGTFDMSGNPIQNAMTRYPEDYYVFAQGEFCDKDNDGVFDGDEWPMGGGKESSCPQGSTKVDGQKCSTIDTSTEPGKLAQLRCYAEGMQDMNKDSEVSTCLREVRGNWSAKSADEFLGKNEGPSRARGEHMFELFNYDSANSGSLRGEEHESRGIQVGDNWTDCEVINVFSMTLKKFPDSNDLLAEMVQSERNVSPKPACVASYGEGKTYKMLFKLTKN